MKELKDKHGSKYSTEQLNAWAHMISVGKHCSFEDPPNLPYFVGKARSHKDDTADPQHALSMSTDKPSSIAVSLSPGKCVSLRTECIDQLSGINSLKRVVLIKSSMTPCRRQSLEIFSKAD